MINYVFIFMLFLVSLLIEGSLLAFLPPIFSLIPIHIALGVWIGYLYKSPYYTAAWFFCTVIVIPVNRFLLLPPYIFLLLIPAVILLAKYFFTRQSLTSITGYTCTLTFLGFVLHTLSAMLSERIIAYPLSSILITSLWTVPLMLGLFFTHHGLKRYIEKELYTV